MTDPVRRTPHVHSFLYIYRNHSGEFWWCAVPYLDRHGRRHQRRRSFRDRRYGSRVAALHEARRWRDAALDDPAVRAAMGDRRPLMLYAGDDGESTESGNPFGLVGVTVTFRDKPLGGNFSVTANRGRKKWFSMRRYGGYGAFKRAVIQRCQWVGVPVPDEEELRSRYDRWAQRNRDVLRRYGLEP
ncbi:hypothetical protein ACLD0W_08850 [Alloalcanivorax sp. C16-1]|uniref:hypothetical protein n=1 Tax=Alloalcanivorax sp. C16-1 TaxID=3390051 RepID=UPI0039704D2F